MSTSPEGKTDARAFATCPLCEYGDHLGASPNSPHLTALMVHPHEMDLGPLDFLRFCVHLQGYIHDPETAQLHPHREKGLKDFVWHLFDRMEDLEPVLRAVAGSSE